MAGEVDRVLMEGALGSLRRRGVAAVGEVERTAEGRPLFDGDVGAAERWLMEQLLTLPGASAYRAAPVGRRDGGRQATVAEPGLPSWRVRMVSGVSRVVVGPGPWYDVWRLATARAKRDGHGDGVLVVELLCWELGAESAKALFEGSLGAGEAVYVRGMWGLNDEPMEGSDVVASAWGERDWDELVARADKFTTDQLLAAG